MAISWSGGIGYIIWPYGPASQFGGIEPDGPCSSPSHPVSSCGKFIQVLRLGWRPYQLSPTPGLPSHPGSAIDLVDCLARTSRFFCLEPAAKWPGQAAVINTALLYDATAVNWKTRPRTVRLRREGWTVSCATFEWTSPTDRYRPPRGSVELFIDNRTLILLERVDVSNNSPMCSK